MSVKRKTIQRKSGVKEKHEKAFPERLDGLNAFFEKRNLTHRFGGSYWKKHKPAEVKE